MKVWKAQDEQGEVMRREKIEVYRDKQKMWRWRYIATNGRIMGESGEGYNRRDNCILGVMKVCHLDEIHLDPEKASFADGNLQGGYFKRDDITLDLTIFRSPL